MDEQISYSSEVKREKQNMKEFFSTKMQMNEKQMDEEGGVNQKIKQTLNVDGTIPVEYDENSVYCRKQPI